MQPRNIGPMIDVIFITQEISFYIMWRTLILKPLSNQKWWPKNRPKRADN